MKPPQSLQVLETTYPQAVAHSKVHHLHSTSHSVDQYSSLDTSASSITHLTVHHMNLPVDDKQSISQITSHCKVIADGNNGHQIDESTSHPSSAIVYRGSEESHCESSSPPKLESPCPSPRQVTMSVDNVDSLIARPDEVSSSSRSSSHNEGKSHAKSPIDSIESIESSIVHQDEKKGEKCEERMSSNKVTTSNCYGCGSCITDRYYLLALDEKWHMCCLKCCVCKVSLDSEVSCFTRDSRIYCKEDYYKMFAVKRCTRCGQGINSNDMVMKIRGGRVYHMNCFTCAWCNSTLSPGDYFGLAGNLVYCRSHLSISTSSNNSSCISETLHHSPDREVTPGITSSSSAISNFISVTSASSEMVPCPSTAAVTSTGHNASINSASYFINQQSTAANVSIHSMVNENSHSNFNGNTYISPFTQGHPISHHHASVHQNTSHVITGHQQSHSSSNMHHHHHIHHQHQHSHHHHHQQQSHHSIISLNHSEPVSASPSSSSKFLSDANVHHPPGHHSRHLTHVPDLTSPSVNGSSGGGHSGGGCILGIPRSPPIPTAISSSLMSSSSPPLLLGTSSVTSNGICSSTAVTSASSAATCTVTATAVSTPVVSVSRKGRPRKKRQVAGASPLTSASGGPTVLTPGVLSGHQMLLQATAAAAAAAAVNSTGHLLQHPEDSFTTGPIFGGSEGGIDTSSTVNGTPSSISPPLSNSCHMLNNNTPGSGNSNSSGCSVTSQQHQHQQQQSMIAAGLIHSNSSGRTKRMRTSFKHHQLRTMKQYFSLNQNPDAKDLKALAQKTNLSKRVLQVWFQNARAKWRRNNFKMAECSQIQNADPNSEQGTSINSLASCNTDASQMTMGADTSPMSHHMTDVHSSLHSSITASTSLPHHDASSSNASSMMVELYSDKTSSNQSPHPTGHSLVSLYSNSSESPSSHMVNSACCF